ncbi:hypothetical protein HGP17_25440 [Rhizobium sp. P38BS-XIX]|uniref:hypothetical protein n=1 Tax=Rhizobium sp. P38BS-XIX TaxID=2726740 RepID=UPI001456B965|nr:hypothetical protein [Rhizobium sp. P38BS-XIX]NLS00183.1 hypothetical protein [Rhizobium sp. P38BS-XIX]
MDLQFQPVRMMEPAIVERLRIAFPEKIFGIERVPPTMTLREFERVIRISPFVGLAWMGMKPDPNSGRQLKGKMLWRVYLIFKASGSLETRFKGDAHGLGLDAMIDVSAALLHGIPFDGIGLSSVTAAHAITAEGILDEGVVLAQVDFEIDFQTSPAPYKLKTIEDFKGLNITWAVADGVEGSPELPQNIPTAEE